MKFNYRIASTEDPARCEQDLLFDSVAEMLSCIEQPDSIRKLLREIKEDRVLLQINYHYVNQNDEMEIVTIESELNDNGDPYYSVWRMGDSFSLSASTIREAVLLALVVYPEKGDPSILANLK